MPLHSDLDDPSPGRDERSNLQLLPTEIITDLAARFLVNIPRSEISSWERLLAHVEEAYYFYCDQIVPLAAEIRGTDASESSPTLSTEEPEPRFSAAPHPGIRRISMTATLREIHAKYSRQDSCSDLFPYLSFEAFTAQILSRAMKCSLEDIMEGLRIFNSYKKTVNVCGVILLNASKTHVLAISASHHSRLYFPKGKMMKDETDYACALREAREEIGVDLTAYLAACPLVVKHHKNFPPYRFFAAVGPWETGDTFTPQCTGEIHEIRWVPIAMIRAEFLRRGIHYRLKRKYAANGVETVDRDELEKKIVLESKGVMRKFPFDRRRLSWLVNYYEEICMLASA